MINRGHYHYLISFLRKTVDYKSQAADNTGSESQHLFTDSPTMTLLHQREGFVAVYLVRIAGILHAGHARRNHHHFAELVLNDVGIVERRRGCAVKRGRERVVHQSDLELQCPHRFLLSWLYLFL